MRIMLLLPLMLLLALLGSCGEDKHDHGDHGHGDHAHGDHAHDHGEHAGHGHDDESDSHGEAMQLGTLTVGETSFTVEQFGSLANAEEGVFSLKTDSDAGQVRIWIGSEDGRGSVKALLEYNSDKKHYHGHCEVPAKLGNDAKLWVSVTKDDKTSTGSIAYK